MIKGIKIFSFILVLVSLGYMSYLRLTSSYDIFVQNRIINNVFDRYFYDDKVSANKIVDDDFDYLGYIFIPKFNIKRLIKNGTSDVVLDENYVGLHRLSGDLLSDDLIILAGHNVSNVFSRLHSIQSDDIVYINTLEFQKKFIVYDKKVVDEYDISFLSNNRHHELLLITCTKNKGERLIVFLKEVL